jgi:hypothetical protein
MRPPRSALQRLAVAVGLVALTVPSSSVAHGSQCAVDLEQRNSWTAVNGGAGAVAMQDDDPCRMLAVRDNRTVQTSDDGGTSWVDVGTAPLPPRRLIFGGLGPNAILLPAGDGLLLTTDRGRSWKAATGLSGVVLDVTADELDASTLYAVVRPTGSPTVPVPVTVGLAPGASVYLSHDGGGTFTPVSGSAGLQASSVSPDPGTPGRIWLGVDGVAGGLFLSSDSGATFVRKAGGAVRGLGTSRLAGGGSEVIAATSAGFLVSRDGGDSVSTRSASTDATGLVLEWNHPSAFLALTGGSAVRSSTTGATVHAEGEGLPGDCAATGLVRDRSVPSVFLLHCADGRAWRFRSDGTDLSSTDSPDGTGAVVPPTTLGPSTPMRELTRISIRHRGSGRDGSIAFDGTLLYYADSREEGVVHRQVARTGADAGDLLTRIPRAIVMITYDANRHHLFAMDTKERLWDVRIADGAATRMFHSPLYGASTGQKDDESNNGSITGSFSYDSATDRFLFIEDGDDGWVEYDRRGNKTGGCNSVGLPIVIRINGTPGPANFAGIVATGDGQVYVEAEDDATVLRLDRSCHVLAAFNHEYFSEAGAENDAVACDTTSFGTTAIWLRDAGAGFMAAYEVPGGYCALPSVVTVTSPAGVAAGQRGPVCATLRLRSTQAPLRGLPVDILVAGRGIASPMTDGRGQACADYVPLAREAGAAKGPGRHSATQPVLAAFLGTPAYRPSSARRTVIVSDEIPGTPSVVHAVTPVVHAVAPVVAIPVAPPAQPPPPPPNVPQSQPIAQGHPGAQPGAQGAPGGAMAPEDEEEIAAQSADVAEFRARQDPSLVWPAAAVPVAAGVLLAAVVARRRRASRVRGQWA